MLDNVLILFHHPVFSVDLIVNGMLIGAIFMLAAYGMALVWGVMDVINIAQGEFVMLGGYVTLFVVKMGFSPLVGIPVSAIVLFGVGWVIYKVVIFRVVERDVFTSLLATYGIAILLAQLLNETFGADVQTVSTGMGTWFFLDNNVTVAVVKVVAFTLALALGLLLWLFLKKSRTGQAIRATAQNPRAARILGIDTHHTFAMTYSLSAALCGAAGSLAIMAWAVQPYLGLPYTVRSFMIVVVAGVGNLIGVILAGLGLGVAENVAGFVFGAEFQIAFVFLLMIAVLVTRSTLLRRKRKYLR